MYQTLGRILQASEREKHIGTLIFIITGTPGPKVLPRKHWQQQVSYNYDYYY